MNEGTLKSKWSRHVRKQGFEVKALSPHQIPGLPDLVVVDKAESEVIRDLWRTRVHFIEAKIFKDRPDCFRAERDATAKQVEWIVTWGMLGVRTWWLILDQSKWIMVQGSQLVVKRDKFKKGAKRYGDKVGQLCAPEKNRHVVADAMDTALDRRRLKIAEMFNG